MKVAKIIRTIAIVLIVAALVLILAFVLIENRELSRLADGDVRRAQKIEAIRNDKSNWKIYSNSNLGFLLMVPAEATVRDASLVTAGSFKDIDFDDSRKLIIDTVNSPEGIQISTMDNIVRVQRVPVGGNRTNIYTLEHLFSLQSYLSKQNIMLDNLEDTNLLKLSDYSYYYPGRKQLLFTISGGKSVEWFLNDNLLFPPVYINSVEGEQVRLLQLDILKTIQFTE